MLRYVTPTLYVDEELATPLNLEATVAYLQAETRDGPPVTVASWFEAYRVLRAIGLRDVEARQRINFARTGDMYATRTAARRRILAGDRAYGPTGEVAEL